MAKAVKKHKRTIRPHGIVRAWTDGAYSVGGIHDGKGGWGAVIVYPNGNTVEVSGQAMNADNNRMELLAVIEVLERTLPGQRVDIYSDSAYVVHGMKRGLCKKWRNNGWENKGKPVLNVDLWIQLLELVKHRTVNFILVKGHSKDIMNIRADRLAVSAKEGGLR